MGAGDFQYRAVGSLASAPTCATPQAFAGTFPACRLERGQDPAASALRRITWGQGLGSLAQRFALRADLGRHGGEPLMFQSFVKSHGRTRFVAPGGLLSKIARRPQGKEGRDARGADQTRRD